MLARFTVTQEDIDGGCRASALNCVVARVLQRLFFNLQVTVARRHFSLVHPDPKRPKRLICQPTLPQSVINIIANFDAGQCIHPFSFTCEIPDALAKYFDRRIDMKPQRAGALVTA